MQPRRRCRGSGLARSQARRGDPVRDGTGEAQALKDHVASLPRSFSGSSSFRAETIAEATRELNATVQPILEQYRNAMRMVAATTDSLGIKVATSDPDAASAH